MAKHCSRLLLLFMGPIFLFYALRASGADTTSFDISPDKIEARLMHPDSSELRISVRNTGTAPITKLTLSSLELRDSKSGRATLLPAIELKNVSLAAQQEKEFSFTPPRPRYAGTYIGALRVVANETERRSVPLTVQTRGPWSYYLRPLPVFLVVVLIGFLLSSALDKWMGTGLPRAQALLSLRRVQGAFAQFITDLEKWEQQNPGRARLMNTRSRVALIAAQLSNEIATSDNIAPAQLAQDAQNFDALSQKLRLLLSALAEARTKYAGADPVLDAVIGQLDSVDISAGDSNAYRDKLLAALKAPTQPTHIAGAAAALPGGAPTVFNIAAATVTDIENKIKRMALLYQVAIVLVVFFTAYTTFYYPNPAFGSSLDYIALFLWSLGLTQTGKQLLAKAH